MLRIQDHLSQNSRRVLTFLIALTILGLAVQYLGLTAKEDKEGLSSLDSLIVRQQLIDVRTADKKELEKLPRIGPKMAERIIAYRSEYGFEKVSDLTRVRGIGKKTLARVLPFVVKFGEPDSLSIQSVKVDSLLNINTATRSELQQLKGIGEVKAQRIIDKRKEMGKFSSVEDLTNVKGIGEKTLAKLKPYICCE